MAKVKELGNGVIRVTDNQEKNNVREGTFSTKLTTFIVWGRVAMFGPVTIVMIAEINVHAKTSIQIEQCPNGFLIPLFFKLAATIFFKI